MVIYGICFNPITLAMVPRGGYTRYGLIDRHPLNRAFMAYGVRRCGVAAL